MSEKEFWLNIALSFCCRTDCSPCPGRNECRQVVTNTECADTLHRAHVTTQPPWLDLLSAANCPPCGQGNNGCYMTEKNRECWLAYLKKKYDWEPVEVPK